MKEAMQIPAAREAVEKEYAKLESKPTWLLKTVKERKQVIAEAALTGKTVHFGTLMELCSKKHSEMAEEFHIWKGRVVFRGDQVKDETGHFAVFSEQGTSASQMSAAKFLDATARCPGCKGEDSDAVGAYAQVILKDIAKVKGVEHITTWITLPRNRRPAWWSKFSEPVPELKRNLYGYPLAGLVWEKHCQIALCKF